MPDESAEVSDNEREHLIRLLQQGVGLGLLSLDECTERTEKALRAHNRDQLRAVLLDLPELAAQVIDVAKPVELEVVGGRLIRQGRWTVPGRLRVQACRSQVVLDFTQAELLRPIVRLELRLDRSAARLTVPRDMAVHTDEIKATTWELTDRTRLTQPATRRLVLSGEVSRGMLEVLPAQRSLFQRIWHSMT